MEDKNTEQLVNMILKGKNAKALNKLEKIIQKKCADKISETLKS